tara:strand:+ start:184 stop:348 length:165 start_codon:yes stop_codon:yes gene_type:complete
MSIRRPVDMGDDFKKKMTLITDSASDKYLAEHSRRKEVLKYLKGELSVTGKSLS